MEGTENVSLLFWLRAQLPHMLRNDEYCRIYNIEKYSNALQLYVRQRTIDLMRHGATELELQAGHFKEIRKDFFICAGE